MSIDQLFTVSASCLSAAAAKLAQQDVLPNMRLSEASALALLGEAVAENNRRAVAAHARKRTDLAPPKAPATPGKRRPGRG